MQWKHHLAVHMYSVNKFFCQAQSSYERQLNARSCQIQCNVHPSDSVSVKTTLSKPPHKRVPLASEPFLVVAFGPHKITIYCPDKAVVKIFQNLIAKASGFHEDNLRDVPASQKNLTCALDLPTLVPSRLITLHICALKKVVQVEITLF